MLLAAAALNALPFGYTLGFTPATDESWLSDPDPGKNAYQTGRFRVAESGDLTELAADSGPIIRRRDLFYLEYGDLAGAPTLVTYPASLLDPDRSFRGWEIVARIENATRIPRAFLDPFRVEGLARTELAIDPRYDPVLTPESAEALDRRPGIEGSLRGGVAYRIVADSTTAVGSLRVMVRPGVMYVVSEDELRDLGVELHR